MNRNLQTEIQKFLKQQALLPQSLEVGVATGRGVRLAHTRHGLPRKIYDVSSLTKVMVTVPLVARLVESHATTLSTTLAAILPELHASAIGRLTLKECLTHTGGLVWWRPFFKSITAADSAFGMARNKAILLRLLMREKTKENSKAVYSDPDFMLLGFVCEEIYGMPLEQAASQFVFAPLGLKNTFFQSVRGGVGEHISISDFAPTELTKTRGRVQGVVNDENAFAMGGVSGHAGLFSNLNDLLFYGRAWLAALKGKDGLNISKTTARLFSTRAVSKRQGDWALGWMIPSKPVSSGGRLISDGAFGHLGFTGTSLWIDPARDAVVSVLSNRTFPNRSLLEKQMKALRPVLHDLIWRKL